MTKRPSLGRNVVALGIVSFFTDVSSEMIYPLLPVFLTSVLGASPSMLGVIEGAAETTAAFLKLASGWWSDRVRRRKPLVVIGYSIAAAMRPLVAIAQSASQVLLIRVSDRVGKGIRNSPRDALIADSVDPGIRGRAFGFHRAADNAGAVFGPLIAFALLNYAHAPIRRVFWLAVVPGVLAIAVLLVGVRDVARPVPASKQDGIDVRAPLPKRFWALLAAIFLFTLGNSTDAFLLLRATQLGVPVALLPILWAALHVVKSVSSTPGGSLSDRVGRKPTLITGWLLYAIVYIAFAVATEQWQAWTIFLVYGVFFGLTEGAERAFVSDIVAADVRGTAFGWYYLAVGLAALPASVLFGVLWQRLGPFVAFTAGAAIAVVATAVLAAVPARS